VLDTLAMSQDYSACLVRVLASDCYTSNLYETGVNVKNISVFDAYRHGLAMRHCLFPNGLVFR